MTAAALIKTQLAAGPTTTEGEEIALSGLRGLRLYETGDPDWYTRLERAPAPSVGPAPPVPDDFAGRTSHQTRLARVAPSMQDVTPHSAGWLFADENREILDFGTAIHHLFEQIEWIEDADVESILARWLAESDDTPEVKRDVGEQFRNVLTRTAVRRLLSRPAGDVELWREKRFEVVLDGRWVTGVFDRVTIHKGTADEPARAVIVDYKSNRIGTEAECLAAAESYRPQLELYARALAAMRPVAPHAIERKLVFTRAGRVLDSA
jgi:hypothetical protein